MKRFALIGAAGFVAPRHMAAIRDTGNVLVAAHDPNDSVGVIDSYFPEAAFFTDFARFERHVERERRASRPLDHVAIASPNHLHDSHIRFALRAGAGAICEKPVVLNPWNIDALQEVERETGQRIATILQLRLHPAIAALRARLQAEPADRVHEVDLAYITSRGRWYAQSWKGDTEKSGGIATNIGVHFFDMLHHLFGNLLESAVHLHSPSRAAGFLRLERAHVRWFLSIEAPDLPMAARADGRTTWRSITVDGEEIEFSGGFTDLHTRSYAEIIDGRGFGLEDARAAIETVATIRTASVRAAAERHPFVWRAA